MQSTTEAYHTAVKAKVALDPVSTTKGISDQQTVSGTEWPAVFAFVWGKGAGSKKGSESIEARAKRVEHATVFRAGFKSHSSGVSTPPAPTPKP